MSSFISSSTRNLFRFATWLHCITHINMWVFSSWYLCNFLHFVVFYHLLLRKNVAWEKCKGLWLNHFSYQVLISISSNFLQWLIVSYLWICRWLQVDVYLIIFCIFMFFSVFLLRKISPGKSFQNHFKFTTWIHYIIPIYMFVITSWYILLFFWILGWFLVFLFRKMLTGNIIIFHHNFYFFVLIICIFHLRVCVKL